MLDKRQEIYIIPYLLEDWLFNTWNDAKYKGYHLWNILHRFWSRWYKFEWIMDTIWIDLFNLWVYTIYFVERCPMDRTEEQNKRLALFMKKVKDEGRNNETSQS